MTRSKADLILHPVRYQILITLLRRQLNTEQMAAELPNVPVSSLYRHLKTLLNAGLVQVAEIRQVKGIQEKVYQAAEPPRLQQPDYTQTTKADHEHYFAAYVSFLLESYSYYLNSHAVIDMAQDRAGYTDAVLYMNEVELDALGSGLNQVLAPFRENQPEAGRHRHLLSVITFPMEKKESENGLE